MDCKPTANFPNEDEQLSGASARREFEENCQPLWRSRWANALRSSPEADNALAQLIGRTLQRSKPAWYSKLFRPRRFSRGWLPPLDIFRATEGGDPAQSSGSRLRGVLFIATEPDMSWGRVDRRLTWFAVGRALGGRVLDVYLYLLNYAWRASRKEVGGENTDDALIALGPHVSKAEMMAALGTGKHQVRAAIKMLIDIGWVVQVTEDGAQVAAYKLGRRFPKASGKGLDEELFSSNTLDLIEELLAPKVRAEKLQSPVELPVSVRLAAAREAIGRGGHHRHLVGGGGAAEPRSTRPPVPEEPRTGAASPPPPSPEGAARSGVASAERADSSCAPPTSSAGAERKRQASLSDKGSENLSQEGPERESGKSSSEQRPDDRPTDNGATDRPTTTPDATDPPQPSSAPPLGSTALAELESEWVQLHLQKFGEPPMKWGQTETAMVTKLLEEFSSTGDAIDYVRYLFTRWDERDGLRQRWRTAQVTPTVRFAFSRVGDLYSDALLFAREERERLAADARREEESARWEAERLIREAAAREAEAERRAAAEAAVRAMTPEQRERRERARVIATEFTRRGGGRWRKSQGQRLVALIEEFGADDVLAMVHCVFAHPRGSQARDIDYFLKEAPHIIAFWMRSAGGVMHDEYLKWKAELATRSVPQTLGGVIRPADVGGAA